jgi:DNA end-binding protein Ku
MENTRKSPTKLSDIAALSAQLMGAADSKPTLNTAPAEKGVVSRANWTGVLGFGLVSIGIKTYKSTEIEEVKLNMVHHCNHDAPNATPTYTQLQRSGMKCPTCDIEVNGSDILKGYKVGEGEFVIISEDEKKACMVTSDKTMNISSFVKLNELDPLYFESAEYLAPDKGFDKPFFMLRQAMVNRGVVAIAHSSQRGREQTLVIRPYGDKGMIANYMYFDNEVRTCDKWNTPVVDDKEIEIAGMLIDALTDTFDPTEYSDSYMRRYKGLINDKILGNSVADPVVPTAPVADKKADIMALIQASLLTAPSTKKKAKKAAMAVA